MSCSPIPNTEILFSVIFFFMQDLIWAIQVPVFDTEMKLLLYFLLVAMVIHESKDDNLTDLP